MIRKFKVKAAPAPDDAAPEAFPDPPDAAAQPAAVPEPEPATPPPRKSKPAGGRSGREDWLIETHLSLLLCD